MVKERFLKLLKNFKYLKMSRKSSEVYKLRKQGLYEEAYRLAKQYIIEFPDDNDLISSLGWVLYSLIKNSENIELQTKYLNEFNSLPISEEIEFNNTLIKKRMELNTPLSRELKRIKIISKEGNYEIALNELRKLNKEYPNQKQIEMQMGWDIYFYLKENGNLLKAQILVKEFMTLNYTKEDEILKKCIIIVVLKHAEYIPFFLEFVSWWDITNLPKEFYSDQLDSYDKLQPSLAAKIAGAMWKNIKHFKTNGDEYNWVIIFVKSLLTKSNYEWIPYWYVKTVRQLNPDKEIDKSILLPLLRKKKNEFWIWELLANATNDPDLQLSSYCMGYTCKTGDNIFRKNFLKEFALYLSKNKHITEASVVWDKYVRASGLPLDHKDVKPLGWYKKGGDNIDQFIEINLKMAIELLVLGKPHIIGVVDHINENKGITHIPIIGDDFFQLKHIKDNKSKNLKPGDCISIRYEEIKNKKILLLWEKIKKQKIDGLFVPIQIGIVKKNKEKPFANMKVFGQENIFIPSILVKKHKLKSGQAISGWAIYGGHQTGRIDRTWRLILVDNENVRATI